MQYVTVGIEDVKVGDWVYSYDTITGTMTQRQVTEVMALESDHIDYLTIVDEAGNIQVVETTDSHPFWVVTDDPDLERAARSIVDENGIWLYHENVAPTENGFWVEAKDLRIGDVFIGANGEFSTLVDKERVEYPEGIRVYNFTVDGEHNYFIVAETAEFGQTSILVHNAGDCVEKAEKLVKEAISGVDLRGKSYNSGRKLLEKAGFELHETTTTGRRTFVKMHKGMEIFVHYDSGKALFSGQKPHWHIQNPNYFFDALGNLAKNKHIPAY